MIKSNLCFFSVPPKIDRKHLKDIVISAGEVLKLEAGIIAEPPADIIWLMESEIIQTSNDQLVQIVNESNHTKLVAYSAGRNVQVKNGKLKSIL